MSVYITPGYVRSRNDGQRYFISAVMLANLYKVPLHFCKVIEPGEQLPDLHENDVVLAPSERGDYRVPEPVRRIMEYEWDRVCKRDHPRQPGDLL